MDPSRLTTLRDNDPLPPRTSSSGPRGPKVRCGQDSLTCVGKPTKENQDAVLAHASRSQMLVGVFDGHGDEGHKVSDFAKKELARHLFGDKRLHSDPGAAMREAYKLTQQGLSSGSGGDAVYSGCTAVAAYKDRDRLIIANVGDSRAVLGRTETGGHGRQGVGRLRALPLTVDQVPDRPDERARIQALNGKVHPSPIAWVPGNPGYFECAGPERVWDHSGMCGLGMSRSLGDRHMAPFVTAEPEITERRLDPHDKLLVIGSDGVWDMMQNDEAVDIAGRHSEPKAAAREITQLCKQRWHTNTQGMMQDDISCVVVHLSPDSAQGDSESQDRMVASKGREGIPPAHRPPRLPPMAQEDVGMRSGARGNSQPGRARRAPQRHQGRHGHHHNESANQVTRLQSCP